ncbi:uncharacterized protein TNCV_1881031 [Trichonephila clavipes]|nr:uncharacterized protein TNCV_1881031 [Trichonephila clavipes]
MSNHQRLDDGMMWRIVGRLETGERECQVQICREFNLTPSFERNLWKQFQDTGSIERKHVQGRPRAMMAREDPHLSNIARRNRGATASRFSRYLHAATRTHISKLTFQKDFMREGCLPEDLLFHPTHVYEQNITFSLWQTA